MTELSILVPNFNYGRFLPACLDSVLTEARGISTDIIISDNCSTDDSVQVIRQYARRHQNIKVITHDRTIPFQHNWNACLAAAEGNYLHFVCADDVLTEGTLRRKIEALRADERVSLVNQDYEVTDERLEPRHVVSVLGGEHGRGQIVYQIAKLRNNIIGGPSNFMARRIGGLTVSSDYRWLADLDYFVAVLAHGRYRHVGGIGYRYRIHGSALTDSIAETEKTAEWSKWVAGVTVDGNDAVWSMGAAFEVAKMRIRNRIALKKFLS